MFLKETIFYKKNVIVWKCDTVCRWHIMKDILYQLNPSKRKHNYPSIFSRKLRRSNALVIITNFKAHAFPLLYYPAMIHGRLEQTAKEHFCLIMPQVEVRSFYFFTPILSKASFCSSRETGSLSIRSSCGTRPSTDRRQSFVVPRGFSERTKARRDFDTSLSPSIACSSPIALPL